jgi:ribokinase
VQRLRVVVVGGLNMDLIVQVQRLPGPGETVAGDSLVTAPGGKGANQAVAAARLGASVAMVGRVGRDSFGRELKRSLRDEGVSTRWVRLGAPERSTGAALIEVDEHGENSIAVASGANNDLLPEDIPQRAVQTADVVSAALEVPLDAIAEAFRLARLGGVRTVLNVAPAQPVPASLLRASDVVICNEHELGVMLGHAVQPGDEASAARALPVDGDQTFEQSAFRVASVDSTGAGDAFVAGFVSGRWWSAGVPAALRWGCAAGALATTTTGAQPSMPTLSDVRALFDA